MSPHRRRFRAWLAALLFAAAQPALAQLLDELDEALFVESADGRFRSDLSVLWDVEAYYIDQRPPAILVSDDDVLFNPRLAFFIDTTLGRHFYSLVQARIDRGFDPGVAGNLDARFDEYLLRYSPFADARLQLQAGKFATVVGNWVARHDSWRNPLINAPLPYENITTISDHAVPADSAALVARRDINDNKPAWLPIIWGPAYSTGFSAAGLVQKFEYALEFKNASISSRPYAWDAFTRGFDDPTWSGRLGYRPNAAWRIGASVSTGPYLIEPAQLALPPGRSMGDFDQTTLIFDAAWSRRHWEVWAELFLSRFEVPNTEDADTLAYYIEAKYGLSPKWSLAARWNQQVFNEITNALGGESHWDRDTWRMDSALSHQFSRHWQARMQYSYTHKNGPLQQGEQTLSAQLSLKF
ncbi:MAG: hypothetical protein A3H91_18065 [Gammaproteobacteria bacterium RIFCSPLOWO2_02_FULL_61_13]|nr:MAG: hypothetical protein A3H91_18065 [Gammaproteobacteria bacterium RIFCSPLOWO2_02_FULL_61_13]